MLTAIVLVPLVAAAALAAARGLPHAAARFGWLALALLQVVLAVLATAAALPLAPGRLALVERSASLPGLPVRWSLGADGFTLALLLATSVVFAVCAVWAIHEQRRPRQQAALYLFLQGTCAGVFAAQDLIVFFLFFDLSLVGMAYSILRWGSGQARRSALTFFLVTFAGSIALLLGFIGVYLGSGATTFEISALARPGAFTAGTVAGLAVLAAILIGLGVKTPVVPLHSWLPPAHTDAPTIGSVVLAGLLLKTGTIGFVRIAMPILPEAWRQLAWVVVAIGILSALWGALVALAQSDLKRLVAFTSINHMGYVVLAVGAAGIGNNAVAHRIAITGAVVQMVSHALTTGALFLLAGVLRDRRGTSAIGAFGGLAATAPRFSALLAVAALASLGLPGLSGFVAEFQVFAGAIGGTAWAALALPGIVLTAFLLLRVVVRMCTGPSSGAFADLRAHETVAIGALLALSLAVGVAPGPLNALVDPAAQHLAALLQP